MGRIIGIDLGTTNSEAAYMEGGRPTIIPSAEGSAFGGKMFPSVVAFTDDGERLVGEAAKRQSVLNPDRTVTRIKRQMGTDHRVKIGRKQYSPEEISAFILQKIKADAEAFLGEPVTEAVITVPAYFNDSQRQSTKDAGKIAGFEVKRIINEPTAAALAYGLEKEGEHKIVVLDLGGGTFDVTIMEMGEGIFEVVSTSGDTSLGGSDMDDAIVDFLADEFQGKHGIDLRADPKALQRLRDAAEKAKIELSGTLSTEINLPYIWADTSGPKHMELKFSRAKLQDLVEPILNRCDTPIRQAFKDAKMKPSEVDKVILVGGPTRMPITREYFERVIGKKAARGVDPMQCVALGAAIQAGVLQGDVTDVLLLDVTPLTLGIETLGSVMTPLIERNTTIPTRKSQIFSTAADNQPAVEIHVLQGERPMVQDNVALGKFHLVGIPPAPRGVPQIEVTFDLDANGIMNVSAKDLGTGNEQKITITSKTTLSKDEIEQKVRDAEAFADKDKEIKELIEARNQADNLIYTAEKAVKELGDKVSKKQKEAIEDAREKLREAMKGDDLKAIQDATEDFSKAIHEVTQLMYQEIAAKQQAEQAQQAGPTPGAEAASGGASEPEDDNVVDVEYEEVD